MIFLRRQARYVINMLLKLYIILSALMISNEKNENYKVVDLIESYNFYIKIIFIWDHIKKM